MEQPAMNDTKDNGVETFRAELECSEARGNFYEPVTYPFPTTQGEDDISHDGMEEKEEKSEGDALDITTRDSESQTDVNSPHSPLTKMAPKKSISQEIQGVAALLPGRISTGEMDLNRNSSTKSIFNSLIISPSRASGNEERLEDAEERKVAGETVVEKRDVALQKSRWTRYYNGNPRATTLPANLDRTPHPSGGHPKMTRWETFKRKFYLGPKTEATLRAGGTPNVEELEATPGASSSTPMGSGSFYAVTNIEGLDLEGIPPMTQRSRKLFSWTRLKTGLTMKRRTAKAKAEGEQAQANQLAVDGTSVEEGETDDEAAQGTRDKGAHWFETLSQRIFASKRIGEEDKDKDKPIRPSTAHTQQYYDIESNW